ncbi:general secretion pathway protein GspK [Candidatus Sumerlaeota bacterium]|nr:general secretion pathway protein GspK [Candidatus Sumerlaeota bacterium]
MRRNNSDIKGSALIVVMWVSLGLVALALLFGHSMMLEYRAAENLTAGKQSEQAIDGARRYIVNLLSNLDPPGYMPDEEEYPLDDLEIGDARACVIGRSENEDNPDDAVEFRLVDEASKLNLNTATQEMLLGLPEMTNELAAAIVDWRDEDDEVTDNGAESDYYLAGSEGYYAKNARFESIDELRLLNGGDYDLLVGEDYNLNGVLDENENDGDVSPPDDNADGVLNPGILEYVTVFSREWNVQDDGSERINVKNGGNELQEYLAGELGESRAQAIINATRTSARNVNSVLEYYLISGMTEDEFKSVHDGLTVSDETYTEGLVNVNTAPQSVLTCVPGIGEEYAGTLVAQRLTLDTEALHSIAWIASVLPRENAIEAGPYLTTRSRQFRADLAAVGKYGRGYRREAFVIDTAGDDAMVVYRKDLSRLGWALGRDMRNDLLEEMTGEE